MKRFFTLIILTLAFSSFAAAQKKTQSIREVSAAETLASYEKQTWELVKQKNLKAFADFVAEDFYGIYPDSAGVTKSQLLDSLRTFDLKDFKLTDFKVTLLGKEGAIISYKAESRSLDGGGGREVSARAEAVSGWTKRRGKWQIVFYREIAVN